MAIVPTTAGLFALLAQNNIERIGAAIKAKYPDEHYILASGQWLLAVPGKTTREISDSLGVTGVEPAIGSAIIVSFSNYFGRANPQIWEWITARLGAQRG